MFSVFEEVPTEFFRFKIFRANIFAVKLRPLCFPIFAGAMLALLVACESAPMPNLTLVNSCPPR